MLKDLPRNRNPPLSQRITSQQPAYKSTKKCQLFVGFSLPLSLSLSPSLSVSPGRGGRSGPPDSKPTRTFVLSFLLSPGLCFRATNSLSLSLLLDCSRP